MDAAAEREKKILSQLLDLFKKELAPKCIILFGSRAKGTARLGSDFDLAVESTSPDLLQRSALRDRIDEIAGLYRVDLVPLNRVSKEFQNIIRKTGVVLYER